MLMAVGLPLCGFSCCNSWWWFAEFLDFVAVPVASVIYQVIAEVVERKEQRISAVKNYRKVVGKLQMDSENIQEEMPIKMKKCNNYK